MGERLALAARGIAYHQPIEYTGPTLKEAHPVSGVVYLTFDHVAGGLQGMAASCSALPWRARIRKVPLPRPRRKSKGRTKVAVRTPEVPQPVAVRFGWADYPVVNLWEHRRFFHVALPHGS